MSLAARLRGPVVTAARVGLSVCLFAAAADAQAPVPVPTAPPFQPAPLQPSLLDFLTGKPISYNCQVLNTDPLLRPPFAGAPLTDPKGLAAKIRAEQLDAKNRVKAAAYLGTVDCVKYPEARDMLVQMLHNDKFEPVRYQAALSLGNMMSRGCSRREERQLRRGTAARYDICKGCCNEKVLEALAKTAYTRDEKGCCFEPSRRVREAAKAAIDACGCHCDEGQVSVMPVPVAPPAPPVTPRPIELKPVPPTTKPRPETPPPVQQPKQEIAPPPGPRREVPPPPKPTAQLDGELTRTSASAEKAALQGTPISALRGYCIVGIQEKRFVKADPTISSVYQHRIYQFASAEAKARFDADPEKYCLDFAGVDPVEFLDRGSVVEGRYLRAYQGRLYAFASKANWEKFKAEPQCYLREFRGTPIGALRGYCIVAINEKEFIKADRMIASLYQNRRYQFASTEAKDRFDADPEKFCVARCGMDPVAFVDRGSAVEGQYLREFKGHLYLFASKANWEKFKAHPEHYLEDGKK